VSTSLITQRIIFDTTDISIALGDFRTGTYAINYTTGKYLYIGTSTPINNLWIELSTPAGASVGSPTVEIWFNGSWSSAVDVIDQTSGLTASGRYSWSIDRNKGVQREQDSATVGLTGTYIYDRYWTRLSWTGAFTAGIKYIGQKFSSDTSLQTHYPDLLQASLLDGFQSGKTTWDDQHFMAADAIIKDLRKRNIILDRGQVFDWQAFEEASCHKVAEIIYKSFGAPYEKQKAEAIKDYNDELGRKYVNVDKNKDGLVTVCERQNQEGWLTR
jgi:hypothetical protein